MFKNIIAPLQAWLISQGRCGGCGTALSSGSHKEVRGQMTVSCRCGRVFIHETATDSYRRALFDEI
ncbi:MAG TPA: hypothetical protein VF828_03885 [Patescibacteria group bacterium]